jgi:hypothetical protein
VVHPELQPLKPYLLFHPSFILKVGKDQLSQQLEELLLDTDVFKKESFAIDIHCRKFILLNVVKRRAVYAWWNLPVIRRNKIIYVDYTFGPPEQLTFEQAREEFVDYVCAHRWCNNSHESPKQFRARNEKYSSMAELIEPVSLKGNLPRGGRKK